ncbi:hypothetical protein Pmani_010625 [Petrolisthes manimaculis]|uniref:Uncharacterized protein n=1 Tax=Petrolisthes manimaculis TaxID=1843537 RepID=A0AAE1UFC4_9EUCA|nr:hypothetical protein Pmani_010625 [Petrolisthes manimaculis]
MAVKGQRHQAISSSPARGSMSSLANPPVISSIVMNWQCAWAQASYNTFKALGGTDEVSKLITVRMLEDSVRMYRMFCGAGALRNVH